MPTITLPIQTIWEITLWLNKIKIRIIKTLIHRRSTLQRRVRELGPSCLTRELIESELALVWETSQVLVQVKPSQPPTSSAKPLHRLVHLSVTSQVTHSHQLQTTLELRSSQRTQVKSKRVKWCSLSPRTNWWHTEDSSWLISNSRNTWRWSKNKSTDSFHHITQPSLHAKRTELWAVTQPTLIRVLWETTTKTESVSFSISSSLSLSRLMSGLDVRFLQCMTDTEEQPVLIILETNFTNLSSETTTSQRIQE